jgi:hypothetical protein
MAPWSIVANRRDFVRATASGIAAISGLPALASGQVYDVPALTLSVLSPPDGQHAAVAKGVSLGISEARHAADLFKQRVVVSSLQSGTVAAWIESAQRSGAHALLCTDPEQTRDLSEACNRAGLILLNILSADDALRRERCSRFTFHVAASDAMKSSATKQARAPAEATVEMWHPELERFGASQLNDRFRATAGDPMSSPAWAGWMAVKIIWEAFLRSPLKTPAALSSFLAADTTAFDGHKGVPLSFRRWDHQLRQPLYVFAPGSDLTEVPVATSRGMSMRDQLDTIGDTDSGAACDS